MRVEAGAVVDEFDLPGIGHVVARHTRTRTPDGGVTWACMFSIAAPGTSDLSVVHRLSAPNLAEGRRSVLHAVEFLSGRALAPMVAPLTDAASSQVPGQSAAGHSVANEQTSVGTIGTGQPKVRAGDQMAGAAALEPTGRFTRTNHPGRRATDTSPAVADKRRGRPEPRFTPLVDAGPQPPRFELP
ncbi:MAG: hypothetical protein ACRDV3_17485 [Acidothermaceae bacterium]